MQPAQGEGQVRGHARIDAPAAVLEHDLHQLRRRLDVALVQVIVRQHVLYHLHTTARGGLGATICGVDERWTAGMLRFSACNG